METKSIESLNSVKLRAVIGTSSISTFGDSQCCQMSVVTEYAYMDRGGIPAIETTWHKCIAWDTTVGKDILPKLKKHAAVELEGRLRPRQYIDGNGVEVHTYEIVVSRLELLAEEMPAFQVQMGKEVAA